MGSPQLTYGARGIAYAGALAYGKTRGICLSKACETVAGIPFGKVVSRGSSDKGCVIGGVKPFGVALRDHGQGMNESSDAYYERYAMVSIIDKDFVYVETVSSSGAYRARVYYDTSTGAIVVTDSPSGTQKLIGYLGQTLTAAGLVMIYVDTEMFYRQADLESDIEDAVDAAILAADIDGLVDTAVEDFVAPGPVTALNGTVANAQTVISWTDPVDTDIDYVKVEVSVTATGVVSSTRNVAAAAETVTVTGLSNFPRCRTYPRPRDTT